MQVISRGTGRAVAVIDEMTLVATKSIGASQVEFEAFMAAWNELLDKGYPMTIPGNYVKEAGLSGDSERMVKLTRERYRAIPFAPSGYGFDVRGLK